MSAPRPFVLLDEGQPHRLSVEVTGSDVQLAPASVAATLGWTVTPAGLCRAGRCVPWAPRARPAPDAPVSLVALAAQLGRPLALDLAEGAAYLGGAAGERAAALATLEAPDFALPDLRGHVHSLRDQRGRKVLLVAWASW